MKIFLQLLCRAPHKDKMSKPQLTEEPEGEHIPFMMLSKEPTCTPLPQRPQKQRVVMRDLGEGKSTPDSITNE